MKNLFVNFWISTKNILPSKDKQIITKIADKMLFFLLSLYPLYKTIDCVRGWNKVKKEHFQHWLTFWLLYVLSGYIHNFVAAMWVLNYFLLIYQWFCVIFLVYCYIPQGSTQVRRYILLLLFRDLKVFIGHIYPYIYPLFHMNELQTLIINRFLYIK